MLRPSQEEFESLARRGNLIPVVREILADTDTPVSLFQRLDDGETSFLFESVEGGEKWARWSFIGVGARASFCARPGVIEWNEGGTRTDFPSEGDPLSFLRDRLARQKPVDIAGEALPRFSGGAVGAVSWDWVRFVEDIPDNNDDELAFPDAWFVLPETVVVYDNVKHRALIIREVALSDGDDPVAKYREAVAGIDALVEKIRAPRAAEGHEATRRGMGLVASESESSYGDMVNRAKGYIEAGDIFQVVLSQRFEVPLQADPLLIYRHSASSESRVRTCSSCAVTNVS